MIYWIFVFFHIVACLVLIGVILLQSGRGGGLSEMAGGSGVEQSQKLFGTQTNALLMKFTSYCAIAFLITSISLVLMTSRRSRSLMEGAQIKPIFNNEETIPMTKDGKPLDKKSLEDALKALAASAQAEKAKVNAEGAKLVDSSAPAEGTPVQSATAADKAATAVPSAATPAGTTSTPAAPAAAEAK